MTREFPAPVADRQAGENVKRCVESARFGRREELIPPRWNQACTARCCGGRPHSASDWFAPARGSVSDFALTRAVQERGEAFVGGLPRALLQIWTPIVIAIQPGQIEEN